tara:strand:- start:416 stop:1723 length:1308 start_codon:yes stop_codon:yes gene_type:complete
MFDDIQGKFGRILKNIRGQGKITEKNVTESMREVRRALLDADVNFKVVKKFTQRVIDKATGDVVFDSVKPGQQFIKIILDELIAVLGDNKEEIKFGSPITTIVLAGLQGSGKTTTSVKLAHFIKNKYKKDPCIIAADLQRPAAVEQLEILAKSIDIPVYSKKGGKAIDSVKYGIDSAKKNNNNLIIVDTAGRLHVDDDLMEELKSIVDLSNPNEILFVADSMTGQDAVNSSQAFNDLIDISGVVLTKLDGDTRGGAAISILETIKKPIKFSGLGEKISDLEIFDPERIAKRILGMGDVVGLVEKAKQVFDEKENEKIKKKIEENKFDLNDFKDQLKQIKKMGSMKEVLAMMPGVGNKLKGLDMDDNKLKWVEAIINSMTDEERKNPEIMNGSRRERVSKGCGRSIQEINQLLKQFTMMKNMMKKMNKRTKFRFPI